MGSPAVSLGELLATGKVVRSHLGRREESSPQWDLGRLAGCFVEIMGTGAAARLTAATRLVHEAQLLGEPVAWIVPEAASFYPPDVAAHGVDLEALVVVRLAEADAMLRAADQLLRSGAFGLVVLDLPARTDIPLAVQVRLMNLARGHDAVLLCLLPEGEANHFSRRGGSLASLRAVSRRKRASNGRFSCALHVVKDKRHGRGWEHVEVLDGPVGLR